MAAGGVLMNHSEPLNCVVSARLSPSHSAETRPRHAARFGRLNTDEHVSWLGGEASGKASGKASAKVAVDFALRRRQSAERTDGAQSRALEIYGKANFSDM